MPLKRFLNSNAKLRRIVVAIALVSVTLGLLSVELLVRSEFASVAVLRDTAGDSAEDRQLLTRFLAMHVDVETAVRGYVITHDSAFLAPYDAALRQRATLLERLGDSKDARLRASLPQLRDLSDARLRDASRNVRDVADGNIERARQRIASGVGKRIMDQLRNEVGTLYRVQAARLARVTEASAETGALVERSITFLLLIIAVLLIVATVMVNESLRQRRAAMDRVRRMATRQQAMFEGAVDGMLLLDENGHIVRMNPSISRMFGYTQDDLIGRHNMFLMQDQFSLEQSRAWLHHVGEAGVNGAGKRQEFTGRRADGSTFDTEVAISRVASAEGPRYIASIRDITHRKRAERMKSEFVSTVSHELRTPLTSIGGSLGLLAAGAVGPLNDKAARLVGIAHSNCERLIRLINDILDIEKIESGKMNFDMRRLTLAPLIERTVTANRQYAADHSVTLDVRMPPWPQCISGDPDRLEQVFTNLISNAIKHSPPAETVEIWGIETAGRLRVEVRDRGAGVPQGFRDRIFGKFAMADASDARTRGGTGLGLAIVREIMEHHGGRAGFEDREGGGSVFYVEMPQLAAVDEQSSVQAHLPIVLHLDDDIDCLSVVASAFAGRARVVSVESLAQARLSLDRDSFAASIIDIGVNSENGLDLLPELRAAAGDLPIVLFTAHDELSSHPGADATLVKSRTPIEALVETTMALINRAQRSAA